MAVPSDSLPSTTTEAQDLTAHGQRRINLIWEVTQALIAVSVASATLYVSARMALNVSGEAFLLLSNGFFLVIGFYFGRTNHQRIGGSTAPWEGR
jgi:hypothetical protein